MLKLVDKKTLSPIISTWLIITLQMLLSTQVLARQQAVLPLNQGHLPSLKAGFLRGASQVQSAAFAQSKDQHEYKKYLNAGFSLKWGIQTEENFNKYYAHQKSSAVRHGLRIIQSWVQLCKQDEKEQLQGVRIVKDLLKSERDETVKNALLQSLAYHASGISPRTGNKVAKIKSNSEESLKFLIASQDSDNVSVAAQLWYTSFSRGESVGLCNRLQHEYCFHTPLLAVFERILLKNSKSGDEEKIAKAYEKMAQKAANSQVLPLYSQSLNYWSLAYKGGRLNPKGFEKTLKNYQLVCESRAEMQGTAFCALVSKKRYNFVMNELALAMKNSGKSRTSAQFAVNYRTSGVSSEQSEAVGYSLAALYLRSSQFDAALGLCSELEGMHKEETKTVKATKCAWDAAAALSGWPSIPPFESERSTIIAEYGETLLGLSMKLGSHKGLSQQQNMSYIAHAGLIQISLGQEQLGYDLFKSTILNQSLSDTKTKEKMLGFLVYNHHHRSNWAALEEVCRIGLAKNISAAKKNEKLNLRNYLADALFNGGKEAIDQGKFELAVKKLEEFVKDYPREPRRPEGMYNLATAYQGKGSHELALNTLDTVVDSYPKANIYFAALLKAYNLASDMAMEEHTMKFGAKFMSQFASTDEVTQVGPSLLQLYRARQIYDRAIATARALSLSPKFDTESQRQYTILALELTLSYADNKIVLSQAQSLLGRSDLPSDFKAKVISVLAQKAFSDKKVPELAKLDMSLEHLGSEHMDVNYTRSEIRFMMAELDLDAWDQNLGDDFGLRIADPTQELKSFAGRYQRIKGAYEALCHLVESPYCAAGMYSLARRSERYLSVLESIKIPETLAEAEVKSYENEKTKLSILLGKTVLTADRRAAEGSNSQDINPKWDRALTYHNTRDIEVSDETRDALGFVEWAVVESSTEE